MFGKGEKSRNGVARTESSFPFLSTLGDHRLVDRVWHRFFRIGFRSFAAPAAVGVDADAGAGGEHSMAFTARALTAPIAGGRTAANADATPTATAAPAQLEHVPSAAERACDPAHLKIIHDLYSSRAQTIINLLLAFDSYFKWYYPFKESIPYDSPVDKRYVIPRRAQLFCRIPRRAQLFCRICPGPWHSQARSRFRQHVLGDRHG